MAQTWKTTTARNFYLSHYEVHNTLHLYRGFKIFLLFEADEKNLRKFLLSNKTQPPLRKWKAKALHVLFHLVSHEFMTLTLHKEQKVIFQVIFTKMLVIYSQE